MIIRLTRPQIEQRRSMAMALLFSFRACVKKLGHHCACSDVRQQWQLLQEESRLDGYFYHGGSHTPRNFNIEFFGWMRQQVITALPLPGMANRPSSFCHRTRLPHQHAYDIAQEKYVYLESVRCELCIMWSCRLHWPVSHVQFRTLVNGIRIASAHSRQTNVHHTLYSSWNIQVLYCIADSAGGQPAVWVNHACW